MKITIPTARVYTPLLKPARYKGAHGGRGSGKSRFFGGLLIETCLAEPTRAVCLREVQKSIKLSVKLLLEDTIQSLRLGKDFTVMEESIKCPHGGFITFQGMQDHTAESIKSLEGYDIAWFEEAQNASHRSLELLRPTIRKPGSQLWFSWNPNKPTDPIDEFLRGENRVKSDAIVVEANYRDNPWFGGVLEQEMLIDRARDLDTFNHVWEGGYRIISDAVIFKNRVSVQEFETTPGSRFYYGMDFGFSNDPSVIERCYIEDDCLYIDCEAGGIGVELDELPALMDTVPGIRDWPIKADCSRPETISHLRGKGFNIAAAKKWQGSVEDGITHLKGFKHIFIHPRCKIIAKEAVEYCWKVDKNGDILPIIVDKHNHGWDACVAEGELIHTHRGQIPIEKVIVGDFVLTRFGYKIVEQSHCTGVKEIWEIDIGDKKLFATGNHRVFTQKGFVRVDALRYCDEGLIIVGVFACLLRKLSNIKAKSTGVTRRAKTGLTLIITKLAVQTRNMNTCTATYGGIIMAIYRRVMISTMLMNAHQTIQSKISNVCLVGNTQGRTSGMQSVTKNACRTLTKSDLSQRSGTLAPRDWQNIKKLVRLRIETLFQKQSHVSGAKRASCQKQLATETSFVQTPASRRGDEISSWMKWFSSAGNAIKNICTISISRQFIVTAPVQCVRATGLSVRVYDLAIKDLPEFFANGILVHNCRYSLDGFITSRGGVGLWEQLAED